MTRNQRIFSAALLAGAAVVLLVIPKHEPLTYHSNKGKVFGTYYAIQYESDRELHDSILSAFDAFDASLSMFNPQSVLSRVNTGTDSVVDAFFAEMYRTAEDVHARSHGAFDITVAPLVNLWGFGLRNREQVRPEQVDSLLPHIGMEKIALTKHNGCMVLHKYDAAVQLDAGAIAKGQSCDIIARMLQRNGCTNYLVDIGGEVVAKGSNSKGEPWRIGITRPIDDTSGTVNEIQAVIATTDIALATSGNYRNFYYDGTEKRSHTIDPRTGRPVQHSILSATVRSCSCMRADALATACMVLGEEDALAMIEADPLSACYLIVSDRDTLRIAQSTRWKE